MDTIFRLRSKDPYSDNNIQDKSERAIGAPLDFIRANPQNLLYFFSEHQSVMEIEQRNSNELEIVVKKINSIIFDQRDTNPKDTRINSQQIDKGMVSDSICRYKESCAKIQLVRIHSPYDPIGITIILSMKDVPILID